MKRKVDVYPKNAVKLWHAHYGDVVTPVFNDGRPPDHSVYLVASNLTKPDTSKAIESDKVILVDLETGGSMPVHSSSRVVIHRYASFTLHEGEDNGYE